MELVIAVAASTPTVNVNLAKLALVKRAARVVGQKIACNVLPSIWTVSVSTARQY